MHRPCALFVTSNLTLQTYLGFFSASEAMGCKNLQERTDVPFVASVVNWPSSLAHYLDLSNFL